MCAKLLQLCPTLCNSINCSPPGSSVHRIPQTRILEWVAIPSFRGSSQPRDWTCISCIAGGFFTTEPPGKIPIVLLLMPHHWPGFCEPETEQQENSLHVSKDDTTGFVMVPIKGRQCSYGHWELRVPGSGAWGTLLLLTWNHLQGDLRIARQGWRM